jgi:hypothetical protein
LLTVFGSAVDERRLRPPRDLDVAVRLSPEADIVAVVNGLVDLAGSADIDVMDLDRANVVGRARALGPGCVPLYEAEPGGFARSQMAALTEAMETAHLRRLDLELLAER